MGAILSLFAVYFPTVSSSRLRPVVHVSKSDKVEFFVKRRGSDERLVNESTRKVSLDEFVRQKCSSLSRRFDPAWQYPKYVQTARSAPDFLGLTSTTTSGHFQTILTAFADYSDVDPVHYDR